MSTSDYDIHLSEKNSQSNIRIVMQQNDRLDYLFRPLNPVITQIQSLDSLIDQNVDLCVVVGKNCGTTPCKGGGQRTKIRVFDRTGQLNLVMYVTCPILNIKF